MKRILFSIATLICCSVAMMAQINSYKLNVGPFDKVVVSDRVNVIYRTVPDSAGFVAFEGEADFANGFIFSNSKGKLKINVNPEDANKPNLPTVRVYSDFLVSAENNSDSTLTVDSPAMVPTFSAKVVGNGKIVANNIKSNEVTATIAAGHGSIVLSGKAPKAVYNMVGAGTIQADGMDAETVNCKIAGGGSIGCSALRLLDVRGLGSTTVYFKGHPEIKKVGNIKIVPLTEIPKAE